MIQEVIVVEGKKDVASITKAIRADCLVTNGFSMSVGILSQIEAAYRRRGIIIFTDPDSAGERIRTFLSKRFPNAQHAFLPRQAATGADGRVGVEKADSKQILVALSKVRTAEMKEGQEFTLNDMIESGLAGEADSSAKRDFIGHELGLGWANAKTFLRRLNTYGIARVEFASALKKWEASDD